MKDLTIDCSQYFLVFDSHPNLSNNEHNTTWVDNLKVVRMRASRLFASGYMVQNWHQRLFTGNTVYFYHAEMSLSSDIHVSFNFHFTIRFQQTFQ